MAKSAWASSSARLNRDSFLPFGSCSLCLESAVDPVACSLGDIFCRECALNNILAQKKEIKRAEKAREHEEREAADLKARQDEEAQARAVKEFEMVQLGFNVGGGRGTGAGAGDSVPVGKGSGDSKRGEKRKFSLDEDEVSRNAESERAKARKAIEEEKVIISLLHARPNLFGSCILLTDHRRTRSRYSLRFGCLRLRRHQIRRTSCTRSRRKPKPRPCVLHPNRTTSTLIHCMLWSQSTSPKRNRKRPKASLESAPRARRA